MLKVKSSYNFLTIKQVKKRDQMFLELNFSLLIVEFKKLGVSAPLSEKKVKCLLKLHFYLLQSLNNESL